MSFDASGMRTFSELDILIGGDGWVNSSNEMVALRFVWVGKKMFGMGCGNTPTDSRTYMS